MCTTEIRDSGMFSIFAEDAVDISSVEQIPKVIMYVDISNNKSIKEHCLSMAECKEGLLGHGISRTILFTVKQFYLLLNKL